MVRSRHPRAIPGSRYDAAVQVRHVVLGFLFSAGCGRIGFEPASAVDGAVSADAAPSDASPDAAIPTCAADGLCAALCVMADPDCATTCGDGQCLGNGGELCSTCMTDCATRLPVCGNGACDPGEVETQCYADCGPSAWPWQAEEAAVLAMINSRRTAGFQCPGQSFATTAPPLTLDPAILPAAREWAWEIAHQNFRTGNGDTCNGRTWPERLSPTTYTSFLHSFGAGITPAGAIAAWSADAGACETELMNPAHTIVGLAAAHDVAEVYVLLLR